MYRSMKLAVCAMGATLAAASAQAHPKLTAANPAANATVASPAQLQLTFSERLVPKFSGVDLMMIERPGTKLKAPVKVAPVQATVAPDGKTLIAKLAKPLTSAASPGTGNRPRT